MAGAAPLVSVSPEVTSALLRIAASSDGDAEVLTSKELDDQIATHEKIGLDRLAAAGAASKGMPPERDILSAENSQRTANHLRGIRRALFADGQGAIATPDAQARASGFRLQWNAVPGETIARCPR